MLPLQHVNDLCCHVFACFIHCCVGSGAGMCLQVNFTTTGVQVGLYPQHPLSTGPVSHGPRKKTPLIE